MLGKKPSSSSPGSSLDMGSLCGVMVRSSNEFGSRIMDKPSEECEDRGDGVNLGEVPSVLLDAGSCCLRREEGMLKFVCREGAASEYRRSHRE
jgi:hypothetical protein